MLHHLARAEAYHLVLGDMLENMSRRGGFSTFLECSQMSGCFITV